MAAKSNRKQLFDSGELSAAVERIAGRIAADHLPKKKNSPPFFLVGIQQQGVPLAERIASAIFRKCGVRVEVGKLDISMYRDDVGLRSGLPLIRETEIPFTVDRADVLLVDDVLSSGRTIRAALDALTDYGRPHSIKLAVMVDRGEVEFPIRADYAGFYLDTVPAGKKVLVEFAEVDNGSDGIFERDWKKE